MSLPSEYEIDSDPSRIDFRAAHQMLTESYWTPGITRERVEHGARHSALVIGAYFGDEMVGFARVVSDRLRFAYLCDVIVREDHRGKGVGQAMVRYAMSQPDLDKCRWLLATKDAHGVYEKLGFHPLETPELWMTYKPHSFADPLTTGEGA